MPRPSEYCRKSTRIASASVGVAMRIMQRAYRPTLTGPRRVATMALMRVAAGFVVAVRDIASVRAPGDTADVRTTIDAASGCERLEQRIIRFSPGRSLPRGQKGRQEVLFVISGSGTLHLDGVAHTLEPWTGAFVAPGETYAIETSDGLSAVSVSAPASELGIGEQRRVTVRYEEQPV